MKETGGCCEFRASDAAAILKRNDVVEGSRTRAAAGRSNKPSECEVAPQTRRATRYFKAHRPANARRRVTARGSSMDSDCVNSGCGVTRPFKQTLKFPAAPSLALISESLRPASPIEWMLVVRSNAASVSFICSCLTQSVPWWGGSRLFVDLQPWAHPSAIPCLQNQQKAPRSQATGTWQFLYNTTVRMVILPSRCAKVLP